jgi:hypothetical protein
MVSRVHICLTTTISATMETIGIYPRASRDIHMDTQVCLPSYLPSSFNLFLIASSCDSRAAICCSSICVSCSLVSVGGAKGVTGTVVGTEVGGATAVGTVV